MTYSLPYDPPVFRPPSEAGSLILQLTLGCSHNRCSFCEMYKTKRFTIRPHREIIEEISNLRPFVREKVRRIFLADGDALIYPQKGLVDLLDFFKEAFPHVTRIGMYASPNSLKTKSLNDLKILKEKNLNTLYFGLESGDPDTLVLANKGYNPHEMLTLCKKAQDAGIKMSITAILGLAGKNHSQQHAKATAMWINKLSPRYFSLLTLFQADNDDFLSKIAPMTNGELLEEALCLVRNLHPLQTILRSNHVSNALHLSGRYPKDRENIILQAETALAEAQKSPDWFSQLTEPGVDMS